MARHRFPGRHEPARGHLADLDGAFAYVSITEQGERRHLPRPMTRRTVLVHQRRYFLGEGDRTLRPRLVGLLVGVGANGDWHHGHGTEGKQEANWSAHGVGPFKGRG